MLTLETIVGHIAPILYNLNIIEEQEYMLLGELRRVVKKDLESEIRQVAREYGLELYVVRSAVPAGTVSAILIWLC